MVFPISRVATYRAAHDTDNHVIRHLVTDS